VVTPNCAGFNFLRFLRHHAHIDGVIVPLVAEAVEFETVAEPRQRHDVFLQSNVGATSATASSASAMPASATMSTTTTTMSTTTTTTTMSTVPATGTMPAAAGPRMATTAAIAHMVTAAVPTAAGTRMPTSLVRRTAVVARVVSGFGLPTAVVLRTLAEIGLPLVASMVSRPVAWTFTNIWLVTVEWSLAAEIAAAWLVTRLQHLLPVATPIIELAVTRPVGTGKPMLDPFVFITHAAPVVGVMIPVLDVHIVPIDVPVEVKILIDIDINVAASPIEVIPDGIANRIGCPPSDARREYTTDDVTGGWGEVVRRVVLIGPRTVNDRWLVIGHINALR
jgi:hypothetical protein